MIYDDVLDAFKILGSHVDDASKVFAASLQKIPSPLVTRLNTAISSGHEGQFLQFFEDLKNFRNADINTLKAEDRSTAQAIKDLSDDDWKILTENTKVGELLKVTREKAFQTEFFESLFSGKNPDISTMRITHAVDDQEFIKTLEEFTAARNAQAEVTALNRGISVDEARVLVGQKMAEARENAAPPTLSVAAENAAKPAEKAAEQVQQQVGTSELFASAAGGGSSSPRRMQQPQQQQQANAGANAGKAGSNAQRAPDLDSGLPTYAKKAFASNDPRYDMPAVSLKDDYLNDGKKAKQSWVIKQLSWAVGDGKPFGDYNAETAKKNWDAARINAALAEQKGIKATEIVAPENKPHFIHKVVQFSPENLGAYWHKWTARANAGANTFLRHLNLPNIFADTQYLRPVIKSVDERMKVTGVSGQIYEMQLKMRDLTENMANTNMVTASQYKKEMTKIYEAVTQSAEFQKSAKELSESMDGIIKGLEAKIRILDNKNIKIIGKNGELVDLDKAKHTAFLNEASAGGKSGLTREQTQEAIDYYRNIRDTIDEMRAPDNAAFLNKYLNDTAVPKELTSLPERAKLASFMRTSFIGYHLEDGVVGGSRLGRIGSEVEQRATGYNVLKFSDASFAELNKWNELSLEQQIKATQKKLDISDKKWATLSEADKDAALKEATPKLKAMEARYDEMTRLERAIKNGTASIHDRRVALETKGDRNNPEAVFFTLIGEHRDVKGEWSVPSGNMFATRLLSLEKQGYEEMIAELIDILINDVGTETSKLQTMPIGQIDLFINTAIKDAGNDKYKTEILESIREKLSLLKQSPMQHGPRDVAANTWNPYYIPYITARGFAGIKQQEIPLPMKGVVIEAADLFGKGEKVEKLLKVNMPASAPQSYLTQQWGINNMWARPMAYLLGTETKVPTIKVREDSAVGHYPHESINWMRMITLGDAKFTASEGTGLKDKLKNGYGRVSTWHDNLPGAIKIFTRPFQGGMDLLLPGGIEKGGALAYGVRAAYGGIFAGSVAYTGLMTADKDYGWGDALRDTTNNMLSITRGSINYGSAYAAPKILSGIEWFAEQGIHGLTSTVSHVTGQGDDWTIRNANLGAGNFINNYEIPFIDKSVSGIVSDWIAPNLRIPDVGKDDEDYAVLNPSKNDTNKPSSAGWSAPASITQSYNSQQGASLGWTAPQFNNRAHNLTTSGAGLQLGSTADSAPSATTKRPAWQQFN